MLQNALKQVTATQGTRPAKLTTAFVQVHIVDRIKIVQLAFVDIAVSVKCAKTRPTTA
jgi:hypothetical protein